MKKILSIILAVTIMATFVACSKKSDDEKVNEETKVEDKVEANNDDVDAPKEEQAEEKAEDKADEKEEEKPAKEPSKTPEKEPVKESVSQPEAKPEAKPEPTPEKLTLGNTLLADFKAKANAGQGIEEIASGLIGNPAILFSGATNPVAPGDYLPGFDGEISGFKSAVAFMPMIGSIPFVGYVFELEASESPSAFISTLKKNANLRWLVCAEAEEMVAGSVGNKVFFVMCPKSLEN